MLDLRICLDSRFIMSDIKIKYKKSISSAISSQQISGRNSVSQNIAMKSFSKNLSFGVDFKYV